VVDEVGLQEPRSAPRGAWRALLVVLALFGATGCASIGAPDPIDVDDLSESQLEDEAARAFAAGDIDRSLEASEALLERTSDGKRRQAGLYYAAEAHYADDAPVKAFRHYQSLLRDFPWSPYVPKCEQHVWDIGAAYLAKEPWFMFGDLFSGRERGAEVMREFAAGFPSSKRAPDALVAVASYRYSRKEYEEAVVDWDRVVRKYPDSEWADLAAFRRAECWHYGARGYLYDATPLLRAARDYRRYLSERPNGERRQLAEQRAREVDELIARGELARAELYLLREQDRGARMHLANVALAYPGTEAAAEARALLEKRGWDLSIHSVESLRPPPLEGLGG
jgi:outer membrane protein assembly factor BamD (BamD/ComL family)